jgi:glycerol kinase
MRDKSFIAVHHGGLLSKEKHRILIKWARECSKHVLPLLDNNINKRLIVALDIAEEWTEDKATVGNARKASVDAHAVARQSSNLVLRAIARSIGHAVATAHMADHAIGAALYARRAIKYKGKSELVERQWQIEQLSPEIKEIVLNLIEKKEKHFNI